MCKVPAAARGERQKEREGHHPSAPPPRYMTPRLQNLTEETVDWDLEDVQGLALKTTSMVRVMLNLLHYIACRIVLRRPPRLPLASRQRVVHVALRDIALGWVCCICIYLCAVLCCVLCLCARHCALIGALWAVLILLFYFFWGGFRFC